MTVDIQVSSGVCRKPGERITRSEFLVMAEGDSGGLEKAQWCSLGDRGARTGAHGLKRWRRDRPWPRVGA